MPPRKQVAKPTTKALPVQLWHGANQSLLGFELAHWLEEFRRKHPNGQIIRLAYHKDSVTELEAALHQAVHNAGFFTQRRLVVLEDVLKAEAKGTLAELVKEFVQAPQAETVVVLVESKVAWSKGLGASLKKLGEDGKVTLKEFTDLTPQELERWVTAQFKTQGAPVASGVARLLASLTGNDFFRLSQEVAKLAAYRQGGEVIASDLDLLVAPMIQDDVFVFLEAVGRRDFGAAQAALERQFAVGTSPQSLVGLLAWHLRVLAGVRGQLDSGGRKSSARELAQELGFHPFVVSRALQQIPYYSSDRLVWLYQELSDLDVKLKSNRLTPEILFAAFLGKLATLQVVK